MPMYFDPITPSNIEVNKSTILYSEEFDSAQDDDLTIGSVASTKNSEVPTEIYGDDNRSDDLLNSDPERQLDHPDLVEQRSIHVPTINLFARVMYEEE